MADINVDLTQAGDVVTLGGMKFRRKPRTYTLNLVRTAVVNAQFNGTIQIDPNLAPFLLTSIHIGDTADTNTLTTLEDFFVSAQDNENGYFWTDGVVPRTSFAGDRVFGYVYPSAVAIRANTRITFVIQNKAAAPTAGTATISLRGWTLIPIN
jgi:hypothetical protein